MKHLNTYKIFEAKHLKSYPYDKIYAIVSYFEEKYADAAIKEGWLISLNDNYDDFFDSDKIFQVEKIDQVEEGETEITFHNALSFAKKWGFVVDKYGVIYDFDINKVADDIKPLLRGFDLNLL